MPAWKYWKLESATFSRILEILENGFFSIQSYPGNSGSYDPYISPILEILEIEVCNLRQNAGNIENLSFSTSSYPGNIGNLIFQFSHILEILEIWFFWFLGFLDTWNMYFGSFWNLGIFDEILDFRIFDKFLQCWSIYGPYDP